METEKKITSELSFEDSKTAFFDKTDQELRFSYWIFRIMNIPWLIKMLSGLTMMAIKLRLPVTALIRATIYRQFCGGESIEESKKVVRELGKAEIGAILDYSVEGKANEKDLEKTKQELLNVIIAAKNDPDIPFGCFKLTGIGRFQLLEKISQQKKLTASEEQELIRIEKRLDDICKAAFETAVPVYIDAEESWIQNAIDMLAEKMMQKYNGNRAIVFTTLQMYRWDRPEYLQKLINDSIEKKYILGVKLVRGAYLEKENKRAAAMHYKSPIFSTKGQTDEAFNNGMRTLTDNIGHTEICAGTHNEESCLLLTRIMEEKKLSRNDIRIYFSQLYGMGDHISYNLAQRGYNVTKYLPYGPVKAAIPYLIRRARENTSISGQMGRELSIIHREIMRRKVSGE